MRGDKKGMSIKPVDFQLSIPRAMEMSKVKGDELHKEQVQQQNQSQAIQHQAEKSLRQVQNKEKAEEARIRDKQEKEKRKDQQSNHSNQKENNQTLKKDVEMNKTSIIDVKI